MEFSNWREQVLVLMCKKSLLSRQNWRATRLTFVLLIASIFQVQAYEGWGQGNVTLSFKDAPLQKVFVEIYKQTGYHFAYEREVIRKAKPVSIEVKDVTVMEALERCFEGQVITYEVEGKMIILVDKSEYKRKNIIDTFIRTRGGISGRVVNTAGEPLAGANITLLRTGKGTITNANGVFKLAEIEEDDKIKISFVGYQTQTVRVENNTSLNIKLDYAHNELDNVLVQGYGITSKRLSTGNIGRISAEELEKHPVLNPIQILQGQIPGALITNADGLTSSSVKVEIRGRNTIDPNLVSEPLYIIDGVPLTVLNISNIKSIVGGSAISQGTIQSGLPTASAGTGQSPFFAINPNDIESIEVLKDADATAIYGSRAANGVILITTKKAKAGKTKTQFSMYQGYSKVTRYYSLLNTSEYVTMRKEALANDGLPVNSQTASDLVSWDTTLYTDWQDYIFGGIGKQTNIQANISGGDARTSFRASAGYNFSSDIATEKGGHYRGSFSINLNHKSINQKLLFSWSAIYSISKINPANRTGSVLLPPNSPAVYDKDGNLNYSGWGTLANRFSFGGVLESYGSRTNFLNSNIILSYEFAKGLTIGTTVGYNNSQNRQVHAVPITSQNPMINPTGTLRLGYTNFHNLILEPKIEYATFLAKGKLSVMIGGTSQINKTEGILNTGTNYENDLLLNSINNAPNKSIIVNDGEYKYAGIFTRINYNWKNKYIVNLNARRDGSTRFGPGRQFGNFGSVGAVWIFSEERWVKPLGFLSFGKLRGSYGLTGSDQILDYQYLSRWVVGGSLGSTGTYNSNVPIYPLSFSDSLLQWEVNKKLEFSALFGVFNDKITFEISWYRNICDNQLVGFPTPAYTGFTSVTSNSPAKIENKGWEFIMNLKILELKTFNWTTKINLAINRNKLISYPNFLQSPYAASLVIGQPLFIQKLLHSTGVDPQTGEYTFEDVNGDGVVLVNASSSNDDRQPIILAPKFDGSANSSFTYKNWSVSIMFYFRKQNGTSIYASSNIPGTMFNQATEVLKRWKKPGDATTVGKFTTRGPLNSLYYFSSSDARITDASFIRLQNMAINYQVPQKIRRKVGLTNFKIYLQAENLFLITNYKGIDPEVQTLGAIPRPRIVTVGLSADF